MGQQPPMGSHPRPEKTLSVQVEAVSQVRHPCGGRSSKMGEGTGVLESSVLSGYFPQPKEQQAVEESGVLPLVLLKPQVFCSDSRDSVQDPFFSV